MVWYGFTGMIKVLNEDAFLIVAFVLVQLHVGACIQTQSTQLRCCTCSRPPHL
jgi:hypothetical protein